MCRRRCRALRLLSCTRSNDGTWLVAIGTVVIDDDVDDDKDACMCEMFNHIYVCDTNEVKLEIRK